MAGFLCGHAANQRIADTLRISDDPARAGVGRQDAGVTPQSVLIVFLDIKKAHFWADARRRILGELPAETGVDTQKFVGLLKKSLYGTQDAPANWEATILRVMNLLGLRIRARTFQQLPLLPPSSRHQSGGPRRRLHWTWSQGSAGVVFHGSWQALDGGKAWLFGSTGNAWDQAEHRHPELTWTERGIELEADPRHAELIIREMGCQGAKVTTALVKERLEEVESSEPLEP